VREVVNQFSPAAELSAAIKNLPKFSRLRNMNIMIKPFNAPLYRGLARIFCVIVVAWTGLIIFWVRNENFDVVRPDEKTMERVDRWLGGVDSLRALSDLPKDRRLLIQKSLDTGIYLINGKERKLSPAELKGCKTILENGFSPQVKEAIARAIENVEAARSLSGMDHSFQRYSRINTPMWDFRGMVGLNLENLKGAVQGTVFWINEIQTLDGMESHFAVGMVKKFKPSGEFTGLVTEDDFALFYDLQKAQKARWFLKPLFWVTAWLFPLLGLLITGVAGVELVRWIGRGFRNPEISKTC
jgi:hypothetical protein